MNILFFIVLSIIISLNVFYVSVLIKERHEMKKLKFYHWLIAHLTNTVAMLYTIYMLTLRG